MTEPRILAETARDHLSQRFATGVDRDAWVAGVPLDGPVALRQLGRAERGQPARPPQGLYDDPPPRLPVPTRTDILAGLALLAKVRETADKQELLLISGARHRGLTWEQLASVIGVDTRQAAEQRWRRLADRYPDEVKALPRDLPAEALEEGQIDIPRPGYLRDPAALAPASL